MEIISISLKSSIEKHGGGNHLSHFTDALVVNQNEIQKLDQLAERGVKLVADKHQQILEIIKAAKYELATFCQNANLKLECRMSLNS